MRLSIEEAKRRLTIFHLWEILELDGNPGRNCRSPFRDDAKPSFSVYANGTHWRDFGTNEGGDAIDFLAVARNLTKAEACRQFITLALNGALVPAYSQHSNLISRRTLESPQSRPQLPSNVHTGTSEELEQLRLLRRLRSVSGLRAASDAGFLKFATIRGHAAWMVTDVSRRCIVARRLDGSKWEHTKSKAYMLPRSCGNHLIGGSEADGAPFVLFVEGTPDFLAAFEIAACGGIRAHEFRAVCMPSASGNLSDESCAHLSTAKLVCIVKHRDDAGERAARRWNRALHKRGVRNVICDLKYGAKDLNDFVRGPQFDARLFVAALRTATCEQWGKQS